MPLLEVQDVSVNFTTQDGLVQAVDKVSFSLGEDSVLGIVGESGSGKTQLVLSIMGLLAYNAQVGGQALFQGHDLCHLDRATLNTFRGTQISMIFQDPMTSLNPYLRVSKQMCEVLVAHKGISFKEAKKEAIHMLDAVQMPNSARRINLFPHEFSGGMRQRIMIAMALLSRPKLLIADEPTTALDVTVQAQILKLLADLQREFHMSVILITHNLGVVANFCHNVLVMYAGRVMEYASVDSLFYHAVHPYTHGLLKAIPHPDKKQEELATIPGDPPNLLHMPPGCPFQPRCSQAFAPCNKDLPSLYQVEPDHLSRCFLQRGDSM